MTAKSSASTVETAANPAHKRIDWVPFPEARRLLEQRFQPTLEEIAIWISLGAAAGGLDGYVDAPMYGTATAADLATLPRCTFDHLRREPELLPHMMRAYFDRAALEIFVPRERYLTHAKAVDLLLPNVGDDTSAAALLQARAIAGELDALHPISVVTQHTHGHGADPNYAPIERGMFAKSGIEKSIDAIFPGGNTAYHETETMAERDRRLQARAEEMFEEGLRQKPSKHYSKNYICTALEKEEESGSRVKFDRLTRVIKKPRAPARPTVPNSGSKIFGFKP